MGQTECSETSAYKIQAPGNYPDENIQHTEHGESLKSGTRERIRDFREIYRNYNQFYLVRQKEGINIS